MARKFGTWEQRNGVWDFWPPVVPEGKASIRGIVIAAHNGVYVSSVVCYDETGEALELLRELAAACQSRGLHLWRWQTNFPNFGTRVTWAITRDERKYQRRYHEDGDVIAEEALSAPYGKTKHSEAYGAYQRLLMAVQAL